MQNLLKPGWIFIVNTLPVVVLFLIYFGEFQIIKSLLNEQNIKLWKIFGGILVLFTVLNIVYGIYLLVSRRNVAVYYAVLSLLLYIPFIYLYYYYSWQIIPSAIPQWMIPANQALYVGTFLMPTLAYALFVLVLHYTPADRDYKVWKNILMAALVPLSGYIFAELIIPLWKPLNVFQYNIHASLIVIIAGALFFVFFFIRSVFIFIQKQSEIFIAHQWVWRTFFSIVFPLMGLMVNAKGLVFAEEGTDVSGVFGDFSDSWFYLLAVANGLLLCLPEYNHKTYRLALFAGRSAGFAYSFYFFLVFLPFLPLSIVVIIVALTGILMLTPLVLFILHVYLLSIDYRFLRNYFSAPILSAIAVAGFLVIPLAITCRYWQDKTTLNTALEYLYQPDYQKTYKVDTIALRRTIKKIETRIKQRNGLGNQQPYLSTYYHWLVLDNMTLSDAKINRIEKVFWGRQSFDLRTEDVQDAQVDISAIDVKSTYDTTQNAWKSWIHLNITNNNGDNRLNEFSTIFELPEGAWISDYYLYVGDKKEMGLLAEKKAATWVFSNIRNENKDPGILYYLSGNQVAFRVFPFTKGETRKTGIEILHKEPVQLNLDGHRIQLGANTGKQPSAAFENEHVAYISSLQKQQLPRVYRKPYFHFLVDITKKENIPAYAKRIEKLMAKHQDQAANGLISLVDSDVATFALHTEWKNNLYKQQGSGGFFVDRAIKSAWVRAYQTKSDTYPVLVVVTDSLAGAIFGKDYADWAFACPEGLAFYSLDSNDVLMRHSLLDHPFEAIDSSATLLPAPPVLAFRRGNRVMAYLPNDSLPGIVLKTDALPDDEALIREKNWESALLLQGRWRRQVLHPETLDKEWLRLVKHSFQSKIMMPVTAYIVVENEAQKAILQKKQQQVLSGKPSLDPGEDLQRMSEPGAILMACLMLLFMFFRQLKRRRDATEPL